MRRRLSEIGPAQQIFQQVERRRVEPLQVIEEERQGMFRPGENADELPETHLEAPLRVMRRKLEDRRRFSNDELHFRNEIHNQTCVRSQRLAQGSRQERKVPDSFLPSNGRTRL